MPSEPSRPESPSDASAASGLAFAAATSALPFEALFLASPLPTSVTRLCDGRLMAVNDAWLTLTGRERGSVIGLTGVALGFWPTEAQRQAFVEKLGTPGGAQDQHLLRLASGEEHSVRIHGVRIEAEPAPLLLTVVIEVKREVDAQQAHERSEAALREVNQSLERRVELHRASERLGRLGYWTNTIAEDKVIWSDGLYDITGLPRQDEIHRSKSRAGIHPDDMPNWLAAREAKDGRELEYRWTRPDGTQLWLRTRIGQTAVAGNPQTDFGVVQDITAERDVRERLSEQLALLQNIAARVPGVMFQVRLRTKGIGDFLYVSPGACELVALEPSAIVADASLLLNRIHPQDLPEYMRSLRAHTDDLRPWTYGFRVLLPERGLRWCHTEALPQREADGSVLWHGFTTDVTEARLAEQRMDRQHRMLEAVRGAQALYIEAEDKRRAFEDLLTAFLSLTGSSYGFVGEVYHNEDGSPYMRTHAITNIAWDEASRLFYESQMDAGMAFHNLRSLFGQAMVTAQPVIANDPHHDPRSGGMPAGHPPMDAFLGIPLSVGDRVVAMVGLANQPGGYGLEDVEFLQPLLGTVRQLVLAWRDHAERRRALVELEQTSQALAEKSDTLQATLDSISQGLTKVDASGRIMIYNQQALEMLDLPKALLDTQPTHLAVLAFQRERGDFGEDFSLVEPKFRSYMLQPEGNASPEIYQRKTRAGRTLDVRTRNLPDGSMVRTFSDVTSYIQVQDALREERQRLAWVLEATRPGIWETNLDTGELCIDDRWAEMLGHSVLDLEPVSLTSLSVLMHPDDLERVQASLMAHWLGETPFLDIDLRLRHRLGHWVWINKRGRVHERDTQGRGRYMSGTHLDVSERVAAQEEVLALNASLEQRVSERTAALERSLRDMEAISYSIAHDLRAPLRAVNGFSALITEETDPPLSPMVSDMFVRINSASRRMGQMLTDMLELLRVVRADLAVVPVDLESLARAVAEELAQEAPQAEMVIDHLPTVLGDATLLRQMLHNLMENSLKYSRHRSPPRLELRFDDGVGAFCLRDNGMGFDMAHAGKLFGLFQRLHGGTEVPGTGVGLAIVARIIERHRGRIWAEAQPDAGASFWWTLPRP